MPEERVVELLLLAGAVYWRFEERVEPEPTALSREIRVRPSVTADERVEEDVRAEVPTLVRLLVPVLVRPFISELVRPRTPSAERTRPVLLLPRKDVAFLLPAEVRLPTDDARETLFPLVLAYERCPTEVLEPT